VRCRFKARAPFQETLYTHLLRDLTISHPPLPSIKKQTPRKRGAVPEIKPEWQFSTPVAQTTDKRKAAVAGKLQQDEADPIPIAEN
jgi:hypothetical protein